MTFSIYQNSEKKSIKNSLSPPKQKTWTFLFMSFATKILDHVSRAWCLNFVFGARRKSIYAPEVKLRLVFLVKAQNVVLNLVILNFMPNKRATNLIKAALNLIIFIKYCHLHTYNFIDCRYFSFLHMTFTIIIYNYY